MAEKRPTHRNIVERIVVDGTLELATPAQFGCGDASAVTDMALLYDELERQPLLPGSSIAGALRNYLREVELNYGAAHPSAGRKEDENDLKQERDSFTVALFGGARGDAEGVQSPLVVFDALGTSAGVELRDGVCINPETRTAEDEKKYDLEVLSAGSTFKLRFELALMDDSNRSLRALATALTGLENGEIRLGRRKRRGFGECRVRDWTVRRYRLDQANGLLGWLADDHPDWLKTPLETVSKPKIVDALGGNIELLEDHRERFEVQVKLDLVSSLLVRSGSGPLDSQADVVHLHSFRPDSKGKPEAKPVLPGTSLAGALRARALRIAAGLAGRRVKQAHAFVDELFGPQEIREGAKGVKASRIVASESVVDHGRRLTQNRIRIDRFTGGAYEGALFDEEALFGAGQGRVELKLAMLKPSRAEIGMVMQLLKDLWSGDLALGGEASIGRGRFAGRSARLALGSKVWTLESRPDGSLDITGDQQWLEDCADALLKELAA